MWLKLFALTIILLSVDSGEIAVLILARGGSKGIRLKNLQLVGGSSLLTRAINTARDAGLNDITVSTDHPLIALQALKDNVTVFRRSRVSATDWAPSIWGASEFIAVRPVVNILVLLQVTSPFTRPNHLQSAIQQLNQARPYDCVFSATRSYKLRWNLNKGTLKPANFKVEARVRRQDWDGEFLETGAFYITRRWLIEQGQFQNNNCTVLEVSNLESLEVDTWEDLRIANVLLTANLI